MNMSWRLKLRSIYHIIKGYGVIANIEGLKYTVISLYRKDPLLVTNCVCDLLWWEVGNKRVRSSMGRSMEGMSVIILVDDRGLRK